MKADLDTAVVMCDRRAITARPSVERGWRRENVNVVGFFRMIHFVLILFGKYMPEKEDWL
jgi:hypothetical protein